MTNANLASFAEGAKWGYRLFRTNDYLETFVVRRGQAIFTAGGERIAAAAGDIVVVPIETPYSFANAGDDVLEMTDIHPAGKFATTWLED